MKKSTLFLSLILSVSSVFSAFAQNEYKIDPTKEITTAPDALDGVVAIPTDADGTSVWTLKGGNDWDLGILPLAQWGSKAQHNFVKFQKPTGDYSACGVEGNIYTLICINENGENFSQWGNPGAINMQPAGTIMFSLGFGDKGTFGQDGDYLGLWKVDYEEGKGYVLQNVGRILLGTASYASPISANPIEEKTYVKLYSELAVNEAITDSKIEAAVAKLNAVPAAVTVDLTAVNAAKETVLNSRTQEDLDALIAAVDEALASVSRTNLIVNAEINGADGWTTEREFGGNGPLLNGVSFEYWAGNASDRQAASFNYYQTIEVPNGKYLVSVEMYNSSNGEEGDDHAPNGNAGLYATSGEETSFVGVTTDGASFGTVYNTEVVSVKDGKLTLGVKSIGYLSARWFAADNFNLWYVGELDPKQLTAGDYFIINAESGKFLNGNNAWGTKASVTEAAQLMTIAVLEDGTYTIDSHISNGGANHFVNAGENLFVDGAASAQTIAEIILLYQMFPKETEGELARRFAVLVSTDTLASVANRMELDKSLRHGHVTGGRKRHLIANAMEAILGAMFFDSGFEATRNFIWEVWRPLAAAEAEAPKDSKTKLQEYVQKHDNGALPVYKFLEQTGAAHAPIFTVDVTAMGQTATGSGTSKKAASIVAAAALFKKLAILPADK